MITFAACNEPLELLSDMLLPDLTKLVREDLDYHPGLRVALAV